MTKIAFIHNAFPAGGVGNVTIDIASYLKSFDGYEVYVYASRISDAVITGELSKIITFRRISRQVIPAVRARSIESLVKSDGIDVLVQVTKSIQGIEEIARRTGVRTVVSCHGEPFWHRYAIVFRRQRGVFRKIIWQLYNKRRFEDGGLAMKMAVRRTLKDYNSCDAYTVLCEPYKYETAAGLGISPETSHIYAIENSELSLPDVNYDKEKIILFSGRFENWSKRIDRLFRIWDKVQAKMPEWRLMLVGHGRDWEMLKKMASDMSLERVSFEGYKSSVSDYYKRASVVVLTSETEGWPLALTEAQAQGCICVAFDCSSGVKEILSGESQCGFLVPSYDEEAYVQTLLHISLLTEAEEMKIRQNSVEKVKSYAPEIVAQNWKTLIDDLCKKEDKR